MAEEGRVDSLNSADDTLRRLVTKSPDASSRSRMIFRTSTCSEVMCGEEAGMRVTCSRRVDP